MISRIRLLPPDLIGKVDHVSVVGGTFPKSYYLVRDGYNTFTLVENAVSITITVPAGNYALSVFKTVVQGLLTAGSQNGWAYTMMFPNSATQVNDGKWTFTVANNDSQPSFIFGEDSEVKEQMGFSESPYVFTANSLRSANVVEFIAEDSLFLRSDIVDDHGDDTLLNIYTGGTPDFATIPYNGDVYGSAKSMRSKSNGVYRFYLTNEDGLPIFLNGVNMVFTLMLFKRIDVLEKLSGYITYRYNNLKLSEK